MATQSMKSRKNDDGSTSYTIETSGLDADEDAENAKAGLSSLSQGGKKSSDSYGPAKKQENGKLK